LALRVRAISGHSGETFARATVAAQSSILGLAGGHQHFADLLVTDGKIVLPPPALWELASFR